MQKSLLIKTISLLITAMLVFSTAVIAEDTRPAQVEFSATETLDGIVELEVKVKNTTFMGIQTAIRYDKDVLVPVDEEGKTAQEFKDFARTSDQAHFFDTAGLYLDTEQGLFGFTLYIMPGSEAEGINENGEYTADEKGIVLYRFRFKKTTDNDYSFEIAKEDEVKPYHPAIKEGIIIMDYATGGLEVSVSYVHEEKPVKQETIKPTVIQKESEPTFTDEDRKKDVVCLCIGKNISVAYGKKASVDEENALVVPYISNDRTLVPLRFVSETLGAEVLWEEGWDGCIIKKDDTQIKITFGSAEFTVNGEKMTYDAPIEVVQDRTMVPIRFVSEQLGCDVYWNEKNQAVVIAPLENPWIEDRQAEITALNEMLVTILYNL